MRPKALIFDFFGVICSEVSPFWFREHFTKDVDAMKRQYLEPADRGEVSDRDLFVRLSEVSGIAADEIERDWISKAHINTDLLDYAKSLKPTCVLGLLTNSMSQYFHAVTEDAHLGDVFDEVVVSSEIGHAKPEPEAFEEMLRRLGVAAGESLLIDDNLRNIQAAEHMGMKAYHYTSFEDLKAFLDKDVSMVK